jgi:hypothetical protein
VRGVAVVVGRGVSVGTTGVAVAVGGGSVGVGVLLKLAVQAERSKIMTPIKMIRVFTRKYLQKKGWSILPSRYASDFVGVL